MAVSSSKSTSTSKPPLRKAPKNSRLGIVARSSSTYLKQYRAKRTQDPMSRLTKKLKLMKPYEILAVESSVNSILGNRLVDPMNPWSEDRKVKAMKIGHKDMKTSRR